MKIAVLGAGALGCAMGGVLTEAGHEVWLINRNADQVNAMNSRGLVLRSDGADRTIRVHAAQDAQGVDISTRPLDLIIVLVKSFHTAQAMQAALLKALSVYQPWLSRYSITPESCSPRGWWLFFTSPYQVATKEVVD